MQSRWNDAEASACKGDLVKLRVYTSRLLGQEPSLVLHGGGNTSVKVTEKNLFGESQDLLYVKGSGWDLATIKEQGFAPVSMDVLLKMARLEKLTDAQMVTSQKAAMKDPGAPAPSVEAILHAIIPFKFVDHTHADAVVAISNTPKGPETLREIFGKKVLLMDYVMPGFILARDVFERTRDLKWDQYEGIVLLHHGVFTFSDDARESYERMIRLVSMAEDYLKAKKTFEIPVSAGVSQLDPAKDLVELAGLRKEISKKLGAPAVVSLNASPEALTFANRKDVAAIASRGPLTPDHVIHTKRTPMIIDGPAKASLEKFEADYDAYFKRNTDGKLTRLDTAPRWAVWPGKGVLAIGPNAKRAAVVADISRHTMRAIQWGEALGGWKALPEKDIFEVEYWELEQAKLKKSAAPQPGSINFQGKIALVTGAASGIGKTCAEQLRALGAAIVALDLNPKVTEIFKGADALGLVCDVTDEKAMASAIDAGVKAFGGLDVVVTNAGIFPKSCNIEKQDTETWRKVIEVNLTSHYALLRHCVRYLELAIDPAIVVVASKNVPAPGPGASAYSVSKAGLTQLARVAALEFGPKGVRVNIVHPHAVMDTGLWTPDVLESRAKSYGLSVEEYKKNNILKVEVTTHDVAAMVCAMAGSTFRVTTGAQVALDGGNDRVI